MAAYYAAKTYTFAWSISQEMWIPWESGDTHLQLYTLQEAQGYAAIFNKRGTKPTERCNKIE